MQNLSLLQLLKLLSAGANAPPAGEEGAGSPAITPSCDSTSAPPMPEKEGKKDGGKGEESAAAQKNAPTSSVRAYEIFSSRHEQALRRAQKRED